MRKKMSEYESTSLKGIHAWKSPTLGWFGMAMKAVNWPIDQAADLVTSVPGVKWVLEKTALGLLNLINDAAQWTVRPNSIYQEFAKAGFENVKKPRDVYALDLEDVDHVVGWLGAKYKSLAAAEGAATGTAGLPGIPADVAALVALNLRAIGEYATYYGFDIASQRERLFALNILGLASSPTDAAKQVAMAQLVKIAKEAAAKKAWKELEKHAFVQIVKRIAQAVGTRLTKAKLAQLLPVSGALIGGGFNVYYTSKVCDAAFFLYRERFLAEKYGPDVIEATVKPARTLQPAYKAD